MVAIRDKVDVIYEKVPSCGTDSENSRSATSHVCNSIYGYTAQGTTDNFAIDACRRQVSKVLLV